MTFVVEGPGSALRTVADQLKKLIDVVEAKDITDKNIVWRELALIKVNSNSNYIVNKFRHGVGTEMGWKTNSSSHRRNK